MKKIIYIGIIIAILVLITFAFSACIHKDFEQPPTKEIPVGNVLTIQDVIQIYYDSVSIERPSYKFVDDFSVFAVVSMDDKSGNIYKAAYIQDASAGLNLRLLSSGGLYQGDSIRINLKGLVLSDYSKMIQLDSVHVDNNIVKIATNRNVEPALITIGQITNSYAARLVKLDNVEFISADVGSIYANPEVSENRTLEDCNGNRLIVRTSGYSNFASNVIPEGRGSIVGVLGVFNNDWQLYIRSIGEVKLTKNRCGVVDTVYSMNFNGVVKDAPISFGGWKNISEIGNLKWVGGVINNGTQNVARIRNDQNANTSWLILPKQSLANNVALKFITQAQNTIGASLTLQISTNYDGGDNPQNATWTTLPANIASNLTVTDSGVIDLPSGEVYIAFKFTANAGNSALFYLDDIVIYNKD